MVNTKSNIYTIENNLKVDIPRFLQNVSFCFALVSVTKYHTKTVKKSFVTIAGMISGLKKPIRALITNDHNTNGL